MEVKFFSPQYISVASQQNSPAELFYKAVDGDLSLKSSRRETLNGSMNLIQRAQRISEIPD